ncbi:MAG: insulinase family protein [Ferruginibacter sp.]|nr:insulinase family protein [Ferruginibacter sp.]
MKKSFVCLSALCLFGISAFSQAKLVEKITRQGDAIVIPYEKYLLPNGLTVVLHEDHSDPIVHVDVTYHVGSAREEIGKSGFAHFFEHMMFQGSDHVADEQHFKLISAAGGTLNGSTNLDRTNYFETVPSNQLEKMLWLEADRMGFLLDAVTQKKFEVQRSTVKNERGQNYDNRPYGLTGEFTSKNLYPYGHPYSWLTIGYVEDLNRVSVQDLKNFFLRWYGPNNSTITIGGDIKPAEVIKLVEKYFGAIPRGPEVTKTILPPVVLEKNRYVSYTDNYARLPMMTKTFPTVPIYNADMAALSCLAQVLGQGKTSVLYQQLVKTQKALSASASSRLTELAGEFNFTITPYPGKSLAAMDSLLSEAFVAFERRGVTDEDIAKFKGGIESQYINGLQSVSGKVSQLAGFQTFTGNPNMIGKQLEMNRKVTREDVLRVYNNYIKGKNSVTVSVMVKGQAIAPVMADNYTIDPSKYVKPNYGYEGLKYVKATDKFDRAKIPGNGPNPVVKVPAFWMKQLSNGIEIIGTQNTEIPVVTLSVKIPGGQLAEAADPSKSGLAGITAAMLNEDTKLHTAEQMAVELQKLGSNISVSSAFDGIIFSATTLKKNVNKTLALLEERMLQPSFTQLAFDRIQKQAMEGFKQRRSQPASIASAVFAKINYGNSILGLSDNGTEATIKNLSLRDVEQYYADYLSSQNTRVVVVGDIREQEIVPGFSFLTKLPNKTINLVNPEKAASINKTAVYLIDVPKAAQTEFRVGMPTNLLYDAAGEYYKLGLANYVLGGDFNSRININLREDKGWTYGARSAFSASKYAGNFIFSSGIRADATDSALSELIKEIKNYATNGITPDELAFMKSSLGQRDALAYETGTQKAGFISRMQEYNLPANYIETQNKVLKNMTAAEINALAKKWLDVNKMTILLVGDKATILPGLEKMGYEIIELDADGNRK